MTLIDYAIARQFRQLKSIRKLPTQSHSPGSDLFDGGNPIVLCHRSRFRVFVIRSNQSGIHQMINH